MIDYNDGEGSYDTAHRAMSEDVYQLILGDRGFTNRVLHLPIPTSNAHPDVIKWKVYNGK
jgi:hypothetical protein